MNRQRRRKDEHWAGQTEGRGGNKTRDGHESCALEAALAQGQCALEAARSGGGRGSRQTGWWRGLHSRSALFVHGRQFCGREPLVSHHFRELVQRRL